MVVFPLDSLLTASMILDSVSESRAEVISSKSRICGSLSSALAMATLCFSPPDKVRPLSPTMVSYLFGIPMIESWISASFAASKMSSLDRSRFP
mmetsp:Transcript_10773/g.30326  ORF Transcript_10773/g.30326 Transcript_10773/m.30326 type:complete len:94 (+) Transcript_10773:237-518(+)